MATFGYCKNKYILTIGFLALVFSACDEVPYQEEFIDVVVPYTQKNLNVGELETVKPIEEKVESKPVVSEKSPLPDKVVVVEETQALENSNVEPQKELTNIQETKGLKQEVLTEEIDVPEEAMTREDLKQTWNRLRKTQKEKGLSNEDFQRLIPQTKGLGNYIKYGGLSETQNRLQEVEESLAKLVITKSFFRKKVGEANEFLKSKKLSLEDFTEFQDRISQLEHFVEIGELEKANKNLNTIIIDIGQTEKLDKVLQ